MLIKIIVPGSIISVQFGLGAETLVIARETVHKHLKNIYGKLDVHNRIEAIILARELKLL